jgi:hypothetical protein
MTKKKFLSEKKTSRQTISISPALKEWISRYVNKMQDKHPDDERYKSVSAFYTHVMENAMKSFEKGKTLDDFKRFVDGETYQFYDEFSFKAHRPMVEMCVKPHKYTNLDLSISRFFNDYVSFFKKAFHPNDIKTVETFFERIETYLSSNKISDYIDIKVLNPKESEKSIYNMIVQIETVCPYENICYENNKLYAALFAMFGMKVKDFIYSKKNSYYRWRAVATDQFLKEDLLKEEKLKLFNYNLSFLTNYDNILNDEHDYYLWMKLARDKEVRIDFNSEFARSRWIETIESDIRRFTSRGEKKLTILKFFEKLHWLDIENENDLIFSLRLPDSQTAKKEFLLDCLSKNSRIKKDDETFQLKNYNQY